MDLSTPTRARCGLLLAASLGIWALASGCDQAPDPAPAATTQPASPTAMAHPPIVLIVIDTLRADHLGCYNYFRDTSPNIDQFARSATVFENAFTPIAVTLPAHISLFTGLNPIEHGTRANIQHDGKPFGWRAGMRTITEMLRDAGYQTAAFVSCTPLKASAGLDAGFDVYEDPGRSSLRVAETTAGAAVQWLRGAAADSAERSIFLFAHFFDPHAPLRPPAKHAERFADDAGLSTWIKERKIPERVEETECQGGDATRPLHNLYDAEIHYADAQIARLLQAIRDLGLWDDALIIITADHGEGLNQHGWRAHGRIYDEQLRVPLIVKFPAALQRTMPPRDGTLMSLIDVFPTVLDRIEIDGKERFLRQASGVNVLAPEFRTRPLLAQRTARQCGENDTGAQLKLITDHDRFLYQPTRGHELYTLRDAHEIENLYDDRRDLARELCVQLREEYARQWARAKDFGEAVGAQIDPERLKELVEIGYVGGATEQLDDPNRFIVCE